jgi:hypothetical protein
MKSVMMTRNRFGIGRPGGRGGYPTVLRRRVADGSGEPDRTH